ncbi:MAG: redoxin domain-containing protein [Crocinitomicaceae bacterium]|nr:redoxin domain-containing protein [Crocinitomicaceae bacterium]
MKRKLLSLAVILTATFGLKAQVTTYPVGGAVDDFTITDVHGVSHTLSDYTNAGKWVVLDFFYVGCSSCQVTVPTFSEFHEKYGCNEGDVVCISIDDGDDDAAVLDFESTYSESTGFNPAPAVSGTQGGGNAINMAFGIIAYPTYCVVGPDMTLKIDDIYPIYNLASFETALSGVGFTPTVMSCAVGVDEQNALLNDIAVFPNPAAASATVSVSLDVPSDVTVEVFNLVGALVSTEVYNGVSGENNFTINTSALENGQYILNVSLGDNVARTQVNLNVLK